MRCKIVHTYFSYSALAAAKFQGYFKILLFMLNTLAGLAPSYITELLNLYEPMVAA